MASSSNNSDSIDDLIESIFNIPKDGSNYSDEEVTSSEGGYYVNKSNDNKTFEEKVSDLNVKVAKSQNKSVPIIEKEKETINTDIVIEKKSVIKNQEQGLLSDKKESILLDNSIGDNIEKNTINTISEFKESMVNIECEHPSDSIQKTHTDESKIRNEAEELVNLGEGSFIKNDTWILKSSDTRYDYFYKCKREILENILYGGSLAFESINNELKNAFVPLDGSRNFDLDLTARKMNEVQKWKDRIIYLKIQINVQYAFWKNILDTLKGIINNVEYLKPVSRQESLYYEHMKDFIFYFSKLSSLNENCEMVLRNLDSAFETLSRNVTISLPGRDIDRYNKKSDNSISQVIKKDPDDHKYDSLDLSVTENRKEDKNNNEVKSAKWLT